MLPLHPAARNQVLDHYAFLGSDNPPPTASAPPAYPTYPYLPGADPTAPPPGIFDGPDYNRPAVTTTAKKRHSSSSDDWATSLRRCSSLSESDDWGISPSTSSGDLFTLASDADLHLLEEQLYSNGTGLTCVPTSEPVPFSIRNRAAPATHRDPMRFSIRRKGPASPPLEPASENEMSPGTHIEPVPLCSRREKVRIWLKAKTAHR